MAPERPAGVAGPWNLVVEAVASRQAALICSAPSGRSIPSESSSSHAIVPAAVNTFENKALSELGLAVDLVPPRYRTSYFRHIFSDPAGYSAGYYSYLWTQMLDRDSRKWFMDNGGLTRANGDHYRATVLSQGGTQDYFKMYQAFAGRAPDVQPMLEALGLTGGGTPQTATNTGDETN